MRVRATWVLSFQTLFSRENASENMQIFENLFQKYQGGGQAGLQNSYSGQKNPTTTAKEKTNGTEKKSEVLNTHIYILEYSVVVVSSTSELILLP